MIEHNESYEYWKLYNNARGWCECGATLIVFAEGFFYGHTIPTDIIVR